MPRAEIDLRYVLDQLRMIRNASGGTAKVLAKTLREIEDNPSQFPPLTDVPLSLQKYLHVVVFRKAYIVNGPHDFRFIFAHIQSRTHEKLDRCIGLTAFRRELGYAGIDWNAMDETLEDNLEI